MSMLVFGKGVQSSVTVYTGARNEERGDEELLLNTLIATQNRDRWRQVHTLRE